MQHGRFELPNPDQSSARRWLLVGICGAGMQSFVDVLRTTFGTDVQITGTDVDSASLAEFAVTHPYVSTIPWHVAWLPHLLENVAVVHSVAIPASTPVLEAARRCGRPVTALPTAIGDVLRSVRQLCVAGTHGKTTTTGIASWILRHSQRERTHFIGGEYVSCDSDVSRLSVNAANPRGKSNSIRSASDGLQTLQATVTSSADWAVVESCEYRGSFLSLSPRVSVLTGIERDHFDCFGSIEAQLAVYDDFLSRTNPEGTIVVNQDCELSCRLARRHPQHVITYSARANSTEPVDVSHADWIARPVAASGFRQTFQVWNRERYAAEVTIRIPGRHNRQNSLAAIVAAISSGVSLSDAVHFVQSFPGMKRRFEHRGDWNGIHWIDDYAHHPTAIRETLNTARQVYPSSRLLAVVEPHQISRTEQLFSEFCESLCLADEILVLPVLPARENVTKAACQKLSGRLVRGISESGRQALLAANLDQVHGRLDHAARPGDVVITMGAGRTHKIHDEIHRRLQRNFAA